jgi:hypothetical protein
MRGLPHQGARHSTVDHGDASDGVFLLLHLWMLPSSWAILLTNDIPLLLSSLWMVSRANGSISCEWRRLQQLRVEGSLGARKRRVEPTPGVGQAGRLGPTGPDPSQPGSVAPSLPWVLMYLCTLPPPLTPFWWCHPRIQNGGSPCMQSGLLRFNPRVCSVVTLWSLPPLGVISPSS